MKKKSMLDPKIREAAESLGWNIREHENGTMDICQYSPAGEDFFFTVNIENARSEIYDFYDAFDVDDHIAMWIKAKESGTGGIPSVRRLVEDAEAISEMLKTLAGAIL